MNEYSFLHIFKKKKKKLNLLLKLLLTMVYST